MSEIRRKVVIVGDGACGKSALCNLFSRGIFPQAGYSYPSGAVSEAYFADVEVDGKHVGLTLCDAFGDEGYDRLRPMCYPGSHVVVLCFAIDVPYSLDNLQEKWIHEVRHFCAGIPIVLVGCKSDLRHEPDVIEELRKTSERPLTKEEGIAVAEKIGARIYLECSAKTGFGVREVFQFATYTTLRPNAKPPKRTDGLKGLLGLSEVKSQRKAEEKAEQRIAKYLTDSNALRPLRLFRILIIGKTGCGKTTILSKVRACLSILDDIIDF
ncbi:P-loop containing nucleoside triphosphate hydrolase protein [Athelia psychrophila]|uniref:P-loop containing nucleoside triphosphate hydrolase protein n=1 Tax=Athelia psychrophila TaxID=1759441 RepID=A0A167UUD3_9AGAM|nr:P-loop containing nucleoside triphosphate hydrolase protein [Fibularhizoctonia sp. CBS 109695]